MGILGRTAWVSHVWLTAVMTLVAGIPLFHCRCPDGQVKPLCLNFASEPSNCCCGDACCSPTEGRARGCRADHTPPAGQIKDISCCGQPQGQRSSEPPSGGGHRAEGTGCVKTLAQPESFAPTQAKRVASEDVTLEAVLPAQAALIYSVPASASGQAPWPIHSPAPPTDLLTLLQHLLI